MDKCTGCGDCWQKCPPKKIPSEFDAGLGKRTAIYVPFPQAVPNIPVIDRENCTYFKSRQGCEAPAQCKESAAGRDRLRPARTSSSTEEVGAIVVATGYRALHHRQGAAEGAVKGYGEYGYGKYPRRHRRPAVRAAGLGLRPDRRRDPPPLRRQGAEDGRLPPVRRLARPRQGHRLLLEDLLHVHRQAHDALQAQGARRPGATSSTWTSAPPARATTSSSRRAIEEDGAVYIRGRVSQHLPRTATSRQGPGRRHAVRRAGRDRRRHGRAGHRDAARRPAPRSWPRSSASRYDEHGFYHEAHPKLRPVETNTAGVFLAGACQAPKDIPEAVARRAPTAAKVLALFSTDELEREPTVAGSTSRPAPAASPASASARTGRSSSKEIRDRKGPRSRRVAEVNPGVCQGCGTCEAVCPSKSVELEGFTDEQIYAAINALALWDG